ncbi:class I SAM-dependent methyltransferase [bacterium]|nr:class I SAM-dependent methyltransferase [bacterium]
MRLFFNHKKTITLLLTLINVIIHIVVSYIEGMDFSLIISFLNTEFILVVFYLVVVTYDWVNESLLKIKNDQQSTSLLVSSLYEKLLLEIKAVEKKVSEEQLKGFNEVLSKVDRLELSFEKGKNDIREKTENEFRKTSLSLELLEKNTGIKLEELLTNTSSNQEETRAQINEKAIEQNEYQENFKNELKTLLTDIDLLQQGIKDQINEKSLEQNEYQENFKNELKTLLTGIDLLQQGIKDQINEKSLEQNESHQIVREELESILSNINFLKEGIKTQINEKSEEFVNIQNNIKEFFQETNLKIVSSQQEIKDRLNGGVKNILHNQEGVNSMLEANTQRAEELSSEIIKSFHIKSKNLDFNLTKHSNITYDRLDALMSIHNIIKLNAPLPIMHDWRVSSDFAHSTLSTLLEKKSGSVIDIGSGISTLLFGYGVKRNGKGKVISLEHNKEYYDKSKKLIKEHKLEAYCELYFCPLKEYVLDGKKWLWYDTSNIEFPDNIVLVSVDGPPGGTQYMARYPAIPILEKFITDKTVIYLDDAFRNEEAEIAEEWKSKFGMSFQLTKSHKGFFTLTRELTI